MLMRSVLAASPRRLRTAKRIHKQQDEHLHVAPPVKLTSNAARTQQESADTHDAGGGALVVVAAVASSDADRAASWQLQHYATTHYHYSEANEMSRLKNGDKSRRSAKAQRAAKQARANATAARQQQQQQREQSAAAKRFWSDGSSGSGTGGGQPKQLAQQRVQSCFGRQKVRLSLLPSVALWYDKVIASLLYIMSFFLAIFSALVAALVTKLGWRWFYIAGVTAKRDFTALFSYIRLLLVVKRWERQNLTVSDIFEQNVKQYPDKFAIVSETQAWTFRQVDEFANRIANTFHRDGYKKGDVVGLLLENRAEFVATWLGLSKIGVITPLINTNLRGPSLLHSITVAKCSALIYGEAFVEAVQDILKDIPADTKLYQYNDAADKPVNGTAKDLNAILATAEKDRVNAAAQKAKPHDKLVYIYTSGTTGLPKAAVISHSRFQFIVAGIHYTLGFRHEDVFYTPLPLYHTAGGVMSTGQALLFGSTVAIRKKFSASGYFSDCVKFNATVGQYIGEMARYILATAPSEADSRHKVRLIFGNGLRPQIWPQFITRFRIGKVGEFYGATEGNANIMNNDSTMGAIGFVSRILPKIYPISIIRADPDTGEPIRGPDGLCQLCAPNEPGVFIGKITKGNPSREFLGYVDEKASAKKIVRDVFRKGDMAFLSGDLLVADERGYLFFKDRTGDTFRWKGENVSTSEVEAQVSNVAGYKDTIVYGVTIPNTEGRAGMAAIYDPKREVDLQQFSQKLAKVLPSYARPQFLRFLTKIDLTGTFKLRKVDLQKEGYDPNTISDDLYYQTAKGEYLPLTKDSYEKICRNELRF